MNKLKKQPREYNPTKDLLNEQLIANFCGEVHHETKMAVRAFAVTALFSKTPDARFELATNGLTVHCSTAELIRNKAEILEK